MALRNGSLDGGRFNTWLAFISKFRPLVDSLKSDNTQKSSLRRIDSGIFSISNSCGVACSQRTGFLGFAGVAFRSLYTAPCLGFLTYHAESDEDVARRQMEFMWGMYYNAKT